MPLAESLNLQKNEVMMRLTMALTILFALLAGCNSTPEIPSAKPGHWRAILGTPGGHLPFNFDLDSTAKGYTVRIHNGPEVIEVEEVTVEGDEISMKLPVYDSEIKAAYKNDSLVGTWFNYARGKDYKLPFNAFYGVKDRFVGPEHPVLNDITGRWAVKFIDHNSDTTVAVGQFVQKERYLEGTFLTPTGDYRYLEGTVQGNSMKLSCFDGSHAFLFRANIESGDQMNGVFFSGNHWTERWIATRDDSAALPDPYTLTYLKEGYDKIEFAFPDVDSNIVPFPSEKYRGKVVVLQLMGSWCPNCMDETAFLADYYQKHQGDDFEILAIAFERATSFRHAAENVKRLKTHFKVGYDLVIGGPHPKETAAEKLPMLNQVYSYPTTIFIDKKGQVRKIHTGFSGPATGAAYDAWVKEFEELVQKLKGENPEL